MSDDLDSRRDSIYTPSPWGMEYHALTVHEALGAGSAGPGKSMVLMMDPFDRIAIEHQRCKDKHDPYYHPWGMSVGWALHLRRTFPMLELSIARSHRIFPRVDPGAKYDAQKHTWIFSSGYRYQFGHCKDEASAEQYQSFEFDWIGFDELVQFNENMYDQIIVRCRSSDPVLRKMLKVRSMSNPFFRAEGDLTVSVRDPHWVRRKFVDRNPNGREIFVKKVRVRDESQPQGYRVVDRTRIYLPARLKDNPDPEFVRSYEETLSSAKPHIRQALLEGDWYISPGSFYGDDWDKNLHVIQPFRVPDHWKWFRSMDWGFKQPGTVGWFVIDPDENLIKVRELNFRMMSATDVARRIRDYEKRMGLWGGRRSRIRGPADTQLWEERGDEQHGKTKADYMAAEGVFWDKANKKSRQDNAQKLLERIRDRRGGVPGYMIFSCCVMTIRTLPAIQANPNRPEEPVDGGEDHWHDCDCYAAVHASHGSSRISLLPASVTTSSNDDIPLKVDVSLPGSGRRGVNYGYGSRV